MGLLDSVLGGIGAGGQPQQRAPGLGGTVAAGVILALLVKAVRQHQAQHPQGGPEPRSFDPQTQAGAPPSAGGGLLGGLMGGLGGMLGGAGLGGLLGGLGGAGALGALVGHFQQKGYGPQVGSWVGQGENQPIAPGQLGEALGEPALNQLQQQTGLSRENLLAELSHLLPQAISEVTPAGRLPADEELHRMAAEPPR
jgi:uncharacterized protein YidB (DUF937 family)